MIVGRPTSFAEWAVYTALGFVAMVALALFGLFFGVVLHWLDLLFAHPLGA